MNYGMSRLWAAHMAVERSSALQFTSALRPASLAAIRVLQVARKRHGAAPRRLLPHRTLLEAGTWGRYKPRYNSKGNRGVTLCIAVLY